MSPNDGPAEVLQSAVSKCGDLAGLARAAKVPLSSLTRFAAGVRSDGRPAGLNLATASAVAKALGYRLIPPRGKPPFSAKKGASRR